MKKARPRIPASIPPPVEEEPIPEIELPPPATETEESAALWSDVFGEGTAEETGDSTLSDDDATAISEEDVAFNLELDFPDWDMDAAFLAAMEEPPPDVRPASRTERTGPQFSSVLFSWAGTENHDYEDSGDAAPDAGHAAIADGTTLGGMSGIIARGLVRHFVSGQYNLDTLPEVAAWWLETRREWSKARRECYDHLSSVEQQKMDRGGSATFMALRVVAPAEAILYWVGDCSLFLVPADGGEPEIRGATAFDSHPAVIHYFDDHPERVWRREAVPLTPYRFAVFCTDALAKGLQQEAPWQNDPAFWQTLWGYTAEKFRQWVAEWRDNDLLDADDYTLLLLELPELASGAEVTDPDVAKVEDNADD